MLYLYMQLMQDMIIMLCSSFLFIYYREVEDFARRLNSVWPERMQEILSLGQDRRLLPVSLNGNGAMKKRTGEPFFFFF